MIICLLCATGCKTQEIKEWDWKPHSYIAYSDTQTLEDANGHIVKCTDEEFDGFTGFPEDNIAELKVNIEKMKDNQAQHKANLIAFKMYLKEKDAYTPEMAKYLDLQNVEAIDKGLEETLNLLP